MYRQLVAQDSEPKVVCRQLGPHSPDIPELDDKESHLPGRLNNPNPEVEGLSGAFSPVDLTEEDEEDEEAEEADL